MQALDEDLRRQLEKTVKEARDVAENGARAALERLGVPDKRRPDYLTDDEGDLRVALRAHARQQGDARQSDGAHEVTRLVREAGYEHWHRMLFARFLAENELLIHPEFETAVTLADCEDLAPDEDARDGYALAARYATRMLPQIFREGDPVLRIEMAPEHRNALRRLVEGLPAPVFHAGDSLGWVYQFWQARRKDEVNASGNKIGADELPAVTQLFTEHYMVQFLLDNTLGAWWADRHAGEPLPGVPFEYLRTLPGDGTPAGGGFEGWPDRAADLKIMDPCMGSGHFLVAALPMVAHMRMAEEGLTPQDAVDAALRDNLYGLELDPRCTQIGAFALALAAWTFPGAGGHRALPELNVACSGLAPEGDLRDWEQLAGDDERLQNGMRRLYTLFQDAPTLGSLIDPGAPENRLDTATFDELEPLLAEALARETNGDAERTERSVTAYGIARAAELLNGRYHLVTTNVPFLSRGKQSKSIKRFSEENYAEATQGLDTVFLARGFQFCHLAGTVAFVTKQNWHYLSSYEGFRKRLLKQRSWNAVIGLGPNAFRTPMWDFNVSLNILSNLSPKDNHVAAGISVFDGETSTKKAALLKKADLAEITQANQLGNPDARVILDDLRGSSFLHEHADSLQGITTGDNPQYMRGYWECACGTDEWKFIQSTVGETTPYAGRSGIIRWEDEGQKLSSNPKARIQGLAALDQDGVAVSQMGDLPATLHKGNLFDMNTAILLPAEPSNLKAIWTFCSSDDFARAARKVDKALKVTTASMVKVPFDLEHWQQVAEEQYPDGLPAPQSDDPTQWLFHGHPARSERPLQTAVARLVGYRWPAERAPERFDLAAEAREWATRCQDLHGHADEDGIVCIPAVQGERPAADRLRELLADAYGDDWGEGVLQDLLNEWGYRSGGLEGWLDGATARQKGKFAQQHNKLFGHRPFIWHVSDEHADGFSALVNYHQLDRANLERLTYTYLGDWINQQEAAMERGDDGAEGRLLAAQDLQEELKKIIEGEPPYDIFVRWKEAHEQPIGWEPDLNDGVLLNINPFVEAGVLRDEPNVRYTKDRGKNPEGAPWGPKRYNRYEDVPDEYKLKDEDGDVIEHLTTEVKRRAREAAGGAG